MISIGIVSRDSLTLFGLRYLFQEQPNMRVVVAAGRPLPLAGRSLDCLVIDLDLVGNLPLILEECEGTEVSRTPRVVGLAGGAPWDASAAAEVDAVCPREDAPRLLVNEVLRLITPDGGAQNGCVAGAAVTLSPREEEVLHYLASGFTHDQVARRIGVSRHTVDTYVKRLRAKLDVGNKAQLVTAAWRLRAAESGPAA